MRSIPKTVLAGMVITAATASVSLAQTSRSSFDNETQVFAALETYLSDHAAVIQQGRYPDGNEMGPHCEQFGYNVCASEAFLAVHDTGDSGIAAQIIGEKRRVIIDVRGQTEREWAELGSETAKKITYGSDGYDPTTIGELDREAFAGSVREAVGDLTIPIAVVCSLGVRSRAAAMALREAGFTNVINTADGVLGNAAGDGMAAALGVPVKMPDKE